MNKYTEFRLSATGPGQGASSQYSQYQQGQSQQYSSYRSSQGGPGAQTQRSYAYEQVHQIILSQMHLFTLNLVHI